MPKRKRKNGKGRVSFANVKVGVRRLKNRKSGKTRTNTKSGQKSAKTFRPYGDEPPIGPLADNSTSLALRNASFKTRTEILAASLKYQSFSRKEVNKALRETERTLKDLKGAVKKEKFPRKKI